MPTSTIWRRSAENTSRRAGSPIRPSGDAIERISPEPSFPTFSDAAYLPTSSYYSHDAVQGLGLSHSGLLDAINGSRHSRDIFSEQNEKASTVHRGPDARAHADRNRSPPRMWSYHQSGLNGTYRQSKAKAHTRSGSTIDDLASAAIATDSPQMVNGSPRAYYHNTSPTTLSPTRPSTSHLTYSSRFEGIYEPPAKRIKSERIPAMEWANNGSRPATSHDQSLTLDEDVKLLLGLRTAVNFKTQPSPLQQTAQLYQSPTPRRAELHSQDLTNSTTKQQESSNPHTASEKKPQVDVEVSAQVQAVANEVERHEEATNGVLPDEMELDAILEKPAVDAATATLSVPDLVSTPVPSVEVKKTRRIKPQIQAEVCSECGKFQREADSGNLGITWIECSACSRWFHANCVGLNGKGGTRTVDTFICKKCEPEHGQTTFVRTSSRARTAIDYAELNQGLVKSSIETSMHHYITPIKQNKFTIQKDDFARVRPELLTVEFMESFDNMKRPFVVPADWNPRFGAPRPADLTSGDREQPKERRFDSTGRETEPDLSISNDVATDTVIDCDQDLLDMVMPRDLTVRKVAELYGKHEFVPVIDVKSQETKGQWTLEQWADYYETQEEKPIRNVISLEVSESPIGRLIRRPKVVRDLDLEDHVWDGESRGKQKKRAVQYYCLMSVADSYTDFHIDFGGSAVYYHILKGTKTFFFIPPEDRYLKKYEEWCNSVTQNDIWLPDLCNGAVTRVDLHEGDTAFIPAGWIHSVWTPEDSLVIGGNYLTRIDYELQLKVANVEKLTNVAAKFRYPFFQKVMWYALIKYLDDDPVPEDVLADFEDSPDYTFLRANPVWHEIGELVNTAEPGSPEFNSRYYPKSEISGLRPLRDYLYRTARVAADLPVPDINKKQIDAVKNSVPKGHGDPLVLIKTFAIWCAWKIGNVTAPNWVHSDDGGFADVENKVKKNEAVRLPPERTSLRRAAQSQAQEPIGPAATTPHKPGCTAIAIEPDPAKKVKPSSSPPSTGRSACDACRRRRIRCSHKEATGSPSNSDDVDVSTNAVVAEPQTLAPALDGITHGDTVDGSLPSASLAQAALGNLDTQAYWDPNFRTLNGVVASAAKKSRTKACEECRKSKVSCLDCPNVRKHADDHSAGVSTMSMDESIQRKRLNPRSHEVHLAPNAPPDQVTSMYSRRGSESKKTLIARVTLTH